MSTTDIKVGTINAGKSATATISDVNPAKSNAKLKEFGQKLIALTSNTYQKTDRVITMNCDTETYGGEAVEPTLTLSASSISTKDLSPKVQGYDSVAEITTNSDGAIYVRSAPTDTDEDGVNNATGAFAFVDATAKKLYVSPIKPAQVGYIATQTLHVGVLPTDNFLGKEVAFTVTKEG